MKKKYTHLEAVHNLDSPNEIVPVIIDLLQPRSVIDIGCGIGTFLYGFKKNGVNDVMGVDGKWVDKSLLNKYLSSEEFIEADLERELHLDKKYDLVVSLEVGEHLSEKASDIYIKNLVNSGEVVLFSAALPLQGGDNHINEQWLTYWEEKFLKHGYIVHDVLRPIFWDNPKVFWWYKQNMVIVTKKDFKFSKEVTYNSIRNIVHYELFTGNALVLRGKSKTSVYFILFLKHLFGMKNFNKFKRLFF